MYLLSGTVLKILRITAKPKVPPAPIFFETIKSIDGKVENIE